MPDVDALTRAGDRRLRHRRHRRPGRRPVAAAVAGPGSDRGRPAAAAADRDGRTRSSDDLPATDAAGHLGVGSDHPRRRTTTVDVGHADRRVRPAPASATSSPDPDGTVWSVAGGRRRARSAHVDAKHPRLVVDDGRAARRLGRAESGDHPGVRGARPGTGDDDPVRRRHQPRHGHAGRRGGPGVLLRDRRRHGVLAGRSAAPSRSTSTTGDVRVVDANARNGFDIVDRARTA